MSQTKQIIFISGRFRSGTSMLWNLFNQVHDCHCWYEPLHPNLLKHIKYVKPKDDHLGIEDYWQNYRELDDLKQYYSHRFGQQSLYLEKGDEYKELTEYINYLIQNSNTQTVILQFNRMDLRLSWLKNNFPAAKVIHIYRQPKELWVSTRKHLPEAEQSNESHPDAYDLLQWSADLSQNFPMLAPEKNRSSYFRHYFIWKLAQNLAESHADLKLSLEDDFINSHSGLNKISKLLSWSDSIKDKAIKAIQKPQKLELAPDLINHLKEIENDIDLLFNKLGLSRLFPSNLLKVIKLEKQSAWQKFKPNQFNVVQELLDGLRFQKDEMTNLLNR